MSEKPKKPLTRIKSGAFSRGFALARVSMTAGARAAGHAMGTIFASEDERGERLKQLLLSQVDALTRELGHLKGSLMKVGQMLSVYGEHFLPPEANALLKSLQSQSPPLEWKAIERVLLAELGVEKLAGLDIEHEPLASASLGQVHRARRKSDGRELALKVQYPRVDQAIEGDLKALRTILSVAKLLPTGPRYDALFEEVREMLHQETDYRQELAATDEFRALLADDPRFVVPETFPELSTGRVLATSFEPGVPVDSPEVLALSQERRNALGRAAVELYFRELFLLGRMQTDPHFGNYRVRPDDACGDRIVLLDFGAVKRFAPEFLRPYYTMTDGAIRGERAGIWRGAEGLGFLREDDQQDLRDAFASLCLLLVEAVKGPEPYDWGSSDLPKRAARQAAELALLFKLRPPPREVVFLDRKMGGVFIFLSVLGTRIAVRDILDTYIERGCRRIEQLASPPPGHA
jgi:predicted unusual protein kinase regulating ubiquinone biosynthesis (AarF/ABC1/UbiB family)